MTKLMIMLAMACGAHAAEVGEVTPGASAPQERHTDRPSPWSSVANAKQIEKVATAMVAKYESQFKISPRAQDEIVTMCPGFATFNADQKSKFWHAFVMATAYNESSLKPTIVFNGPAGRYAGLFSHQISKDEATKQKAWNPECIFAKTSEAQNPVTSMDCFGKHLVAKLEKANCLLCQTGQSPTALESPAATQRIRAMMGRIAPCR